jgi:DNA gyrase inhibitor GyrI
LTIGIPQVVDGQLVGYDCCIQVSDTIGNNFGEVKRMILQGGRYAILKLEKDSQTIGATIERFYAEYMPEHHLSQDTSKPAYEVYDLRTMEYCVPLL